jgi:hypothetical protein
MTLDPKDAETAPPEATAGDSGSAAQTYEVPVLIPLGNVHALLAGGGLTTPDGLKGTKKAGS